MENTSLINVFPQEILVRTLHYCDYVTIIRFSLTCKKAQRVVSCSVSLQLHIELEINGLEIADGSSGGNPNYSLALKELRDHQDAWYNLRLGPMVQQSVGASDIDVPDWDLRNGTYHGEFRASEPDDDDDFHVDHTQIAVLGSSTIPPPINFEKEFSSCVVDPKQDLAVLVEDEQEVSEPARFHFRSVTTGKPHPLAEHPVLTVTFDDTFLQENNLLGESVSANPEIVGNYFMARMYWPESECKVSETLLWDWKTGVLLTRIYSENTTDRCTFIDKEHLLVCSALPKNDQRSARIALFIYRVLGSTMDDQVPPNADFRPSSYPKHSPILAFELPELHPSWTITKELFILHSDPLPGDVVYSKSATFLCSRVTTLTLGFRIWYNPDQRPYMFGSSRAQTDFRVFVHTHNLFTYLSRCLSGGTTIVPWSEWGTAATRWFIEDSAIERLMFEIYRSQYPRSTMIRSMYGTQLLSIVDFNAPLVKRHAYTSTLTSRTKRRSINRAERDAILQGMGLIAGRPFQPRISSGKLPIPTVGQALNHQVFTETVGSEMKTIIREGFKNPVESCLPYRAVTKVQRMPAHGHWRIHGEYLVGVPGQDWLERDNPPLSLYKLELPS
ncbi:unnamed protein product [Rhizoctonia solani]|uniref:F-box domain-containing protein n=1 Tax=Rhizoctonia solani TaxID=456999 RepID=A0A8H3DZW5_9AGAM|nr:unnamed protein product [Rhizoctonia solani]